MHTVPVFSPESPQARAITDLFDILLIISAVVLALVTFLIVYSLIRFRARDADVAEPRQMVGNKTLEVVWTVVPFLLVVSIFVLTARAMSHSDPSPGDRPPDLLVVAHQWWWEVHYPKSGALTANEIHIPVGQAILVRLESADVIHDFWAPALGRKMDMVPGHPNHTWIQSDRPGVFLGFCAEYCGAQHAGMRFRVVAEEPEAFARWEQQQLRPPPAPTGGLQKQGAELFQSMTCANCHTVGGPSATPQAAPDLAHLGSRHALAGEVVENTPANLRRWLADPGQLKPGCLMPNLRLNNQQLDALVAWLTTLK